MRDSIQEFRDRERLMERIAGTEREISLQELREAVGYEDEEFDEWMNRPNDAMMQLTPQEVLNAGRADVLQQVIYSHRFGSHD